MHIMDIVENSVAAGANEVSLTIEKNTEKDFLMIQIKDNGSGMDEAMLKMVKDPFVTTKSGKKIGLGLSLLNEAARKSNGEMKIASQLGKGTVVHARFGLKHIDRQPIGDIVETMITLIVGHPDVEFKYCYMKDDESYLWDSKKIRARFGDVFRSDPEVQNYIRKEISSMEFTME